MLPTIKGLIERRILINFRADPNEVLELLPSGMQIRTVNGYALIGVCLIRFKNLRPKGLPSFTGLSSENAAFRISTQWEEHGKIKTGVFVTQRVTNSRFITITGGRFFPGVHLAARFLCDEQQGSVNISINIPGQSDVKIQGDISNEWESKVFDNHEAASEFFSKDKIGYSPKRNGYACEGLELECLSWTTSPLKTSIHDVPYFKSLLPSCEFDHALIMHNIKHKWHSAPNFSA